MIDKLIKKFKPQQDGHGGVVVMPQDMDRVRAAKLITLPRHIPGKNCSNCEFITSSHTCNYPELRGVRVNDRMACIHWNNPNVYESWKHNF